jgi:UDP-N-acetyl-D-mannosaminuronic acid dehydrogenase
MNEAGQVSGLDPDPVARSDASVVVLGCGAVGLPLAVALASRGRFVLGVDTDADRVRHLSQGRCALVEDGLELALKAALARGAIAFSAEVDPADHRRTFIVAVPTPASARSGFDNGPLDAAMATIAAAARDGDLVCLRSTVPIGATRRLAGASGGSRLRWAACPDRSLAGRAFAEQFETPHLVGGLDAAASNLATDLLEGLAPVVRVRDPETAEAIKLFANVSRDVTFALANQFALICEAAGIDVSHVRAAGSHGYVRFDLARPGPVGGPCLSKDVHVLAASESVAGLDLGLLTAARAVNESLAPRVARDILARLPGEERPVAVLGMAFKGVPATADQRDGFGGDLARALRFARPDLEIRTWDPVEAPDHQARDATIQGAAVVVLANDHPDLVAAARELPRSAPDAIVYDLAGVLGSGALGSGNQILRLGDRAPIR